MPEGTYRFPKGFLWGTATSAHQVEGQNKNNNWCAWENETGRIFKGQKAGLACDWWNGRWKEDLGNAAKGGQNSHRLSIEWSRIQPTPNSWDEEALNYYREMLKGMNGLGLEPMVTLHHFTDPLWIYENRGWENDDTPRLFSEFVRKAVGALKDLAHIWITINEPAVVTNGGYLDGSFPPGRNDISAAYAVMLNMLKGHSEAYKIIHKLQPNALVGFAKHYRAFEPSRSWFPPDRWITNFSSHSFNDAFSDALVNGKFKFAFKHDYVPEAIGTQDYIGINYYSLDKVVFKPFAIKDVFHRRHYPEGAQVSETGFIANVPGGMYTALKWAHKFNLPIYITENGVEDSRDSVRPGYLIEHLHQVWRAANFNWQLKGYFHWSQVDNFEWERGWSQRFGLWGLDTDSQRRIYRKSIDLYAAICKANGISSETVRTYAPGILPKLFPD
jgi:beta-glucosidase